MIQVTINPADNINKILHDTFGGEWKWIPSYSAWRSDDDREVYKYRYSKNAHEYFLRTGKQDERIYFM